jgi:hypothetical protein
MLVMCSLYHESVIRGSMMAQEHVQWCNITCIRKKKMKDYLRISFVYKGTDLDQDERALFFSSSL